MEDRALEETRRKMKRKEAILHPKEEISHVHCLHNSLPSIIYKELKKKNRRKAKDITYKPNWDNYTRFPILTLKLEKIY